MMEFLLGLFGVVLVVGWLLDDDDGGDDWPDMWDMMDETDGIQSFDDWDD